MMKNLWIGLLAASSVFAMDEYQPMAEGKTEIDVMYTHMRLTKVWDVDGEAFEFDEALTANAVALQAKYGIIEGLDAELVVPYISGEDVSGLDQPTLGFKYGVTPEVATFLDVALPFGSEDIVGPSPVMSFTLGGLHFLDAGEFSMISRLSLDYNLADEDKFQSGMGINVFLKPGFAATPELQVDLGINYGMTLDDNFDGTAIDDSGSSLLTVAPGVQYLLSEAMALEVTVPIDVMGKNSGGGLAVYAGFYYTM
jgi:hypothetical protein